MANQTGIRMLLDQLKRQIKVYQQALKILLGDKEHPRGQLDELNTEESVEAYVGPPLEIGNELLITVEIVNMYRGLSNALGRVVIIDQISGNEDKAIKASAFGIQVDVDMKVALHMRKAYLRREQAWS